MGRVRAIRFTGPEVLAALGNRKTQHRVVLKPQPLHLTGRGKRIYADTDWRRSWRDGEDDDLPYAPGDLLWVKEGWRDEHPVAIQKGRYSQPGRAGIPGPPPVNYRTIYRADGKPLQAWRRFDGKHPYFTADGPADEIAVNYPTVCSTFARSDGKDVYWENAGHMPRWASRLTLRVTDVRVERVQEISVEDAVAEAPPCWICGGRVDGTSHSDCACFHGTGAAIDSFQILWDSLNAKRGYGWEANPWCCAISFEVIRANVDDVLAKEGKAEAA